MKIKKIKIYYANDLCANMSKLNNLLKYHNVDLHVFFCSVFFKLFVNERLHLIPYLKENDNF